MTAEGAYSGGSVPPTEPGDGSGESRSGWGRLWRAARPALPAHPVSLSDLGQYGSVLRRAGPTAAASGFPDVLSHLASGCASCRADLAELLGLLEES